MRLEDCSIIIPVRNAVGHLKRVVEELYTTEANECYKIFVDDASDDPEVREVLLAYCLKDPKASYLINNRQQLFTRTVNRGIRAAIPSKVYCLLNSDVYLKEGWLQYLLDKFDEDERIGLVGYTNEDEGEYPDIEILRRNPEGLNYITGHCYCIRREVFDEVGLLCETDNSQIHIASEKIHCWRAMAAGWKAFYRRKGLTNHVHGGASWCKPNTEERDLPWLFSYPINYLWKGRDVW